jgi:hypothetical protein
MLYVIYIIGANKLSQLIELVGCNKVTKIAGIVYSFRKGYDHVPHCLSIIGFRRSAKARRDFIFYHCWFPS